MERDELKRRYDDRKRQEYLQKKKRELQLKKAKMLTLGILELLAPFIILAVVIAIIVFIVRNAKDAKGELDDTLQSQQEVMEVSENIIYEPVVEEPPAEPEIAKHDAAKYGLFEGYSLKAGSVPYIDSAEVLSERAVIINAATGEIVASKDGGAIIYPASMTKVMTLMVAVEHLSGEEELDNIVTISSNDTNYAYSHDLSIVGYKIGEETTVRDLLYGTILPSGGDAAHALAVYIAGSEEAFADMMNEKCQELGIANTCHFTNCSGIYNDDHYCTLLDMAIILKAAEENELCRQVLSERIYTTTPTSEHPQGIEISNWFIRRIEDKDVHGKVLGAKTGFVNESGCNAVSYQNSNDGGQYICVTVNAWSSWRAIYDHVAIYDIYTK